MSVLAMDYRIKKSTIVHVPLSLDQFRKSDGKEALNTCLYNIIAYYSAMQVRENMA